MSTNISTSIQVNDNSYLIQASIGSGSDIPIDIFVYENLGTQLGEYIGVCSIQQWINLTGYSPGEEIPVFGNRYVKQTSVAKTIPITSNPQAVVDNIVKDITDFRTKYLQFLEPVLNVYNIA